MKMISYLYIVIAFLLTGQIRAQNSGTTEIEKHLSYLASDEMQGRVTGSNGIEKSANYIIKHFKSLGIQSYYQSYKDTFYLKDGRTGYNILAKIEGTNPAYSKNPVVIGAHYDHVKSKKNINNDSIANGANDNASGTVAVMQLAKYLKSSNPLRPVIFVLFDAEEQGLLGSKHLSERFKKENITPYILFNIEMIGVPLEETPDSAYLTGYEKSNFAEVFNSYLPEPNLIFSDISKRNRLFTRSDNFPFYRIFKIPAHTVSTFDFSNYDYYHHVEDEPDKLNIEHMDQLISKWHEALLNIANHEENIIKMKDQ